MAGNPSAELRALSMRLKAEGQKGLAREMTAVLRSSTVFIEAAVREAADRQLPHSGGLNRQQASQAISTMVLTSARNAGVRMRTSSLGSMQTDKGYVRHPVFGEWLEGQESQQIPQAAGWWTKTLTAKSPLVTPMIVAEMRIIAMRLERGV